MERLTSVLRRIDGKGYPLYKQLKGQYFFQDFSLEVVHVQGDPFAAPSKLAFRVPVSSLGIDEADIRNPSRRVGMEDAILRGLRKVVSSVGGSRGSGKSGIWGILKPGQEMLARTAVELTPEEVVVRLTLGLPANGRRIRGRHAHGMLTEELTEIVERGLFQGDRAQWKEFADRCEDQDALRELLVANQWVAFVANGSCLPRASGADDRPLKEGVTPWQSPPELEKEVELPNAGKIRGTAFTQGVTLICGGGYHGKSTLLGTLARGVYNHIPGDGREFCASLYDTVAVRAEDGRSVCNVNISGFINNLPNGKDTYRFSTENASGSTSQAANIVEALELGSQCLLIDEDTSATNFMVRDRRMQELVATGNEPITPFVDRVRELYEKHGISTLLVVGGAGDYFDVADTVILMESYRPKLATERAQSICGEFPSIRVKEDRVPFSLESSRMPLSEGFDTRSGKKAEKVRANQTRTLQVGESEIDVSFLGQLVDEGQTRTIGDWILSCSRGLVNGKKSLREICEALEGMVRERGLFAAVPSDAGDRVMARRFELAAAINRLRTLKVD